jgi:hypothetical protein
VASTVCDNMRQMRVSICRLADRHEDLHDRTVGPLPDGTVIEVEPAPDLWNPEIIAAWNEAQS